MSRGRVEQRKPRLRSRLRRYGLVRRPETLRSLVARRRLRFSEGNRVELFDTGAEGLASMLAAIEGARERVHLETYILRADETGQRFLRALTERARAGVDVQVLYDAIGCRGLDPAAFRALREAGGDVVEFNPVSRLLVRFAPRRRDHRKILVVDGEVAFTGGLNIGDEYAAGLPGAGEPEWRDAHVRVQGPVVRDLDAVFLESWFRADGPGLPWTTLLGKDPEPAGNVRCAVLSDGPVYRRRRMRELMISALNDATEDVLLESPYFAPGRRVIDALSRASQRGVTVHLLLAGRTDHPILRRAVRRVMPKLLRRGVLFHEYERSMMHAKLAVFDGAWAVIGTSNLDRQSFDYNFEVNLIIEGGEIPERLRERFRRDLESAQRVDLEVLARRGYFERLVDQLSALLVRGI